MNISPIHIDMILTTLGLSPYDFVFGLLLHKASYKLNVIYAYIVKLRKIRKFQKWQNDNNNNKLLELFMEA